jgi:ribose transport system substrate-binding protein
VTNGVEIGRLLASDPTNTVILLGGILRADCNAIIGDMSQSILSNFKVQRAFVSCSGFSAEAGLLERDLQEARMKTLMLRAAQQTIALVDSSKAQTRGLTPFATLDQIDYFVTDAKMPSDIIEQIRCANAAVIVCDEQTVSKYAPHGEDCECFRIGFANLAEAIPFARDVRRGLEQAVTTVNNVELIVADNQLDAQVALKVAEDLIAQAPDLIIEYQIDEQAGNIIAHRLKRVGIPVIAVDIPMIGATFVGVDNYETGLVAGRALGQAVHDKWHGSFDYLVVLEHPRAGHLPALRIQGQIDGFCEHIGPVDESRIIRLDCGNTVAISREQVLNLLDEVLPDSRLSIISFNDDAALGALEAVRATNREQNALIVGQGADRHLRDELRKPESCIIGSTAFHPEFYGQTLIDISLKILAGAPTPPAVYIPHTFIDRHNVDLHYPPDARLNPIHAITDVPRR